MKRIIGIILSVIGIAALATGIIMYQGESDKKEKIKEEEKEEKKEDKPTEKVKLAVGPYKNRYEEKDILLSLRIIIRFLFNFDTLFRAS